MNTKIIASVILIAIFSFGIGASTNLETVKQIIYDSPNQQDLQPSNFMEKNEISKLVDIHSIQDISDKRSFLIQYLWNDDKLPQKMPEIIKENFKDNSLNKIQNLKQITKLENISEFSINSISYLFIPENSNNKLIIYHHGHDGDFVKGLDTIEYLLSEQYSVLAFSMPLTGKNNQPIIEHEKLGKIKLTSHNHLSLLKSTDFNPLKLFLEPINSSLNYVDSNYDFDSYSMIGISGGGWTTIVYSSIDERISNSFPVAGSYPFFLRSDLRNFGDYEQSEIGLYSNVNYLELYILGSFGNDRHQLQIFNKNDPCCFSGTGFEYFDSLIQEKINHIGPGNFEVYLDESHKEHKISEKALELIIKKLNQF